MESHLLPEWPDLNLVLFQHGKERIALKEPLLHWTIRGEDPVKTAVLLSPSQDCQSWVCLKLGVLKSSQIQKSTNPHWIDKLDRMIYEGPLVPTSAALMHHEKCRDALPSRISVTGKCLDLPIQFGGENQHDWPQQKVLANFWRVPDPEFWSK